MSEHDTAASPAARPGPAPRTLTDMPRAGWLAIGKRSVREFKHDDITDRAAALTYYGVLALFPAALYAGLEGPADLPAWFCKATS